MDKRHLPPFLAIRSDDATPAGPRDLTMTEVSSGERIRFTGSSTHPSSAAAGDSLFRLLFVQEGMWFQPATHAVFAEWEVTDPDKVASFLESRRELFLTRKECLTHFALDAAFERLGKPGRFLIVGFYGNEESASTLCRSDPAILEFAATHKPAQYSAVDRTDVKVYSIETPWVAVNLEPSLEVASWTDTERAYLLSELDRNKQDIHGEVDGLSEVQLQFSKSEGSWSIRDVIEHLAVLEEYYHSQLSILSLGPETPEISGRAHGRDSVVQSYAQEFTPKALSKPPTPELSKPYGRFPDGSVCISHFDFVRSIVSRFVAQTEADLRRHFTFRRYPRPRFNVRDLHQLVLTAIAHADWHVEHIRHIKASPRLP